MNSILKAGRFHIHSRTREIFIEGETERLSIRSYDENDYQESLLLYSNVEITQYFDHGKPRSPEEIKAYIQDRGRRYFDNKEPYGLFSLFIKSDGSFIGQIDLVPTGVPGEVEIGWILHKRFHNNGYCSEVVLHFLMPLIQKLASLGFESEGLVINRVIATAHPENISSNKMIQKAGLTFEKSLNRYGGQPRLWYYLSLPLSKKKKRIEQFTQVWNAKNYHHLSYAQNEAAIKILQEIHFESDWRVLDLGCGSGKATAKIARSISCGSILGVDNSSEMINFAKETFPKSLYPNIIFREGNALKIEFHEEFEVVFSSFMVQWIKDKKILFQKVYKSLKKDGIFALVVPTQVSPEFDLAISSITANKAWVNELKNFTPKWYFSSPEEIKSQLLPEVIF